jgi:hypothetical protein
LRDSSELNAHLPFSIGKPLVTMQSRVEPRQWPSGVNRKECMSLHCALQPPSAYATGVNARCAAGHRAAQAAQMRVRQRASGKTTLDHAGPDQVTGAAHHRVSAACAVASSVNGVAWSRQTRPTHRACAARVRARTREARCRCECRCRRRRMARRCQSRADPASRRQSADRPTESRRLPRARTANAE